MPVHVFADQESSGLGQTLEPRSPVYTVPVYVAVRCHRNVAQVHTDAQPVWPLRPSLSELTKSEQELHPTDRRALGAHEFGHGTIAHELDDLPAVALHRSGRGRLEDLDETEGQRLVHRR